MSKPTKTIHNVETNEVIEVELTDQEMAELELHIQERNAANAEVEQKAAQRAILLSKLGITEEETKLLLS